MNGLSAAALKPIQTKGLFDAAAWNAANPDAKDYAGGSYEHFKQVGVPAGAKFPTIAPEQVSDSVVDRVNELTGTDSELLQMARTEGLKAANRRGMLNSSMASDAAHDAALRWAVPIASQEAQQNFQRNTQTRAFEYATHGQDQEIDLQKTIAQWNLDSQDRANAAQFVTNMEQLYNQRYVAILNNPNLSAADRSAYLASARALRDTELDFVQQMYDVDLSWDEVPAAASPTTSGTATATLTPAQQMQAQSRIFGANAPGAQDAWRYGGYAGWLAAGAPGYRFDGR